MKESAGVMVSSTGRQWRGPSCHTEELNTTSNAIVNVTCGMQRETEEEEKSPPNRITIKGIEVEIRQQYANRTGVYFIFYFFAFSLDLFLLRGSDFHE